MIRPHKPVSIRAQKGSTMVVKTRHTAIAAAATILIAGCMPVGSSAPGNGLRTEADAPKACFLPQTLINFRSEADTTLYIRAGRNQTFEVATGGCRDLSSAQSIALTQLIGQGGLSCVGDTVDLSIFGTSLANQEPIRCRARIVDELSADQIVALPSRLRP